MTDQLLMSSMLQSLKQHLDVTRKDLYALTRKTCRECVGEEGSVVDCTNEECTLHKHRLKAIEEVQ